MCQFVGTHLPPVVWWLEQLQVPQPDSSVTARGPTAERGGSRDTGRQWGVRERGRWARGQELGHVSPSSSRTWVVVQGRARCPGAAALCKGHEEEEGTQTQMMMMMKLCLWVSGVCREKQVREAHGVFPQRRQQHRLHGETATACFHFLINLILIKVEFTPQSLSCEARDRHSHETFHVLILTSEKHII